MGAPQTLPEASAQRVRPQAVVQPSQQRSRWVERQWQATRAAAYGPAVVCWGVGAFLGGALLALEVVAPIAFLQARVLARRAAVFAPLCGASRPAGPTRSKHARPQHRPNPRACAEKWVEGKWLWSLVHCRGREGFYFEGGIMPSQLKVCEKSKRGDGADPLVFAGPQFAVHKLLPEGCPAKWPQCVGHLAILRG